ncbi:MAG: hypothetical protein II453_04190 [Alphaproteobacteria bacterium]|nr:hypothetical protein [Alphaproteobacteria bacterium]
MKKTLNELYEEGLIRDHLITLNNELKKNNPHSVLKNVTQVVVFQLLCVGLFFLLVM